MAPEFYPHRYVGSGHRARRGLLLGECMGECGGHPSVAARRKCRTV